uniref:Uncharacterized protein n=2 Tax=Triticum urartu TaxID=4572 RepID=A0A8R7V894_TRIUA
MNHNKGREDAPRKNKGERDEMKGKKEEGNRERHGRAREVSADQTGAPSPPTQASEPGSAKIQPQRTEAEHASSFHFRPSDPGASRKSPHLHSLHGSHPPLLPPTSPRPWHSRPPIKIATTTGRCRSQPSTLHRDKGGGVFRVLGAPGSSFFLLGERGACWDGARQDRDQEDRELVQPPGDLRQAPGRAGEEGPRDRRALRRRGRRRHLLQRRQALRLLDAQDHATEDLGEVPDQLRQDPVGREAQEHQRRDRQGEEGERQHADRAQAYERRGCELPAAQGTDRHRGSSHERPDQPQGQDDGPLEDAQEECMGPKFTTALCISFCTPWEFLEEEFAKICFLLAKKILIMLLLCDLPQEKMLEEEHKLLALRMHQQDDLSSGMREMELGYHQGRDFTSQMPFTFRLQPSHPNLQEDK